MKTATWNLLGVGVAVILLASICSGLTTRCFVCNSRGEAGDCRDPFLHNSTSFRDLPGNPIGVTSCPSGWCRKTVEIVKGPDRHGVKTDRDCFRQPPPDNQERCAKVMIGNKPMLLCLCQGDLCNSAPRVEQSATKVVAVSLISLALFHKFNLADAFLH